ncbi:hypothetical protein BGW80DRAFT_1299696, partial [Lactifluus volemus]
MHPSTPWYTEWYTSFPPLPPQTPESSDIRYAGVVVSSFGTKKVRGGILFSDLSMGWYSVTYGRGTIKRWARFRTCPKPMSGDKLRRAAETHGRNVAHFAEHAAEIGRSVGSGECWDLALKGLEYAASHSEPDNAPILSTDNAHGHLIFCGKRGMGKWRGGDDRLRRGDIVQWRSARIGKAPDAQTTLGEPHHTAVLVRDTVPLPNVTDGKSIEPADVGVLKVVEQSPGVPPKRNSHDLAKLQEGEIWVYRPVSMVEYLGSTLSADIPPKLETMCV